MHDKVKNNYLIEQGLSSHACMGGQLWIWENKAETNLDRPYYIYVYIACTHFFSASHTFFQDGRLWGPPWESSVVENIGVTV